MMYAILCWLLVILTASGSLYFITSYLNGGHSPEKSQAHFAMAFVCMGGMVVSTLVLVKNFGS